MQERVTYRDKLLEERDQLRAENARLENRISELEAENARLLRIAPMCRSISKLLALNLSRRGV